MQCWRVTKYIYSATAYLSILEAKTELKLFRLRFYIKTYDDLIKYSVLFKIKAVKLLASELLAVPTNSKFMQKNFVCFFIYLINHLTPPQIYFVALWRGPTSRLGTTYLNYLSVYKVETSSLLSVLHSLWTLTFSTFLSVLT